MTEQIPLGCHLGLWHTWGRWTEHGEVNIFITHMLRDPPKEVQTGKRYIQKRECHYCGALEFRRATV